jgi:hypothetical protein
MLEGATVVHLLSARRQQRLEEEARKLEEKAQQPKKTVVRRTEWEVEYIKVCYLCILIFNVVSIFLVNFAFFLFYAMKVVAEKTWYLVKESW